MSIKLKRFQSNEAGPFNTDGGRTIANIEVPATVGFTDLNNSQVIFRMKTSVDNKGAGDLMPVLLASYKNENPQFIGGGQALIKNARVTSKQFGILNEQKNQNVVGANLEWFQKSRSGKQAFAQNFSAGNDLHDAAYQGTQFCQFFDYTTPTKIGLEVSTLNENSHNHIAEIRVPLKHVDRFADGIRQFPNISVGDLTYHIELEDVVKNVVAPPGDLQQQCENIPAAVASEIGSPAQPLLYTPVFGRGNTTVGEGKYDETTLNQLPFWLGEPVKVTYTDSGGEKTHTSQIKSLKVDAVTYYLEIVLETPAPTAGATDAVTDIAVEVFVHPDAVFSWEISDIYLEMHCIQLSEQQTAMAQKALKNLQIPYYDYFLVKKNLNLTTFFSDTLQVDPGCIAVAVFTPQNNELISAFDHATDYRWSIDGKPTTDRDVDVGVLIDATGVGNARQLYNYMLEKFFQNMNKVLQRYDGWGLDASQTALAQQDNHSFYPLVTPMLNRDQLLNIQLRSSSNMATKEVFYLIVYQRTLNIQNGVMTK